MNLIHLSRAEYQTLSTTGTLTKAGVTYTFDPLNNEYIVPKEASGGGVTMDLLWENANPDAAFASQTLAIPTNYTLYLIEFARAGASFSPTTTSTYFHILKERGQMSVITVTQTFASKDFRNVSIVSEGVNFDSGNTEIYQASSDIDNSKCRPIRIYGIK